MGHMQVDHVLLGHKLMDHMLTPKEAEPVSCCSLLQAGFIFLKHREMTLEVLGSKEEKRANVFTTE